MATQMTPQQKQILDDVFDAYSMLAGGNIVNLMHVQGNTTRWSPSAVELFDLPGEYIENGAFNWTEYVHPEDRKRYLDAMVPLATGDLHSYDLTYRVRTKNGEYPNFRVIGSVLRNDEGQPSMIGGIMINQGLIENTDPITVLRNKYGFMEDLNVMMKEDRDAVVLMAGISKLSDINKVYGYTYGNRILQEVAWLIQETGGERGKVYRMDDATFAFLTDSLSREEVAAIYDSIRLKLQRGVRVDGVRNILTGNGGMISLRGLQMDASSVCSCLNYAYRESKHRMHGELVDFNGSINYDVRESLEMVNTIRDCIVEGCRGFSISYQPVISSTTGEMIGAEALVRWQGEPWGEVEPLEFIPILEKDFVFEELGNWILHRVCEDGVRLMKSRPDFIMGVNVSPAQLEDEYFIDSVTDILEETGFPAKNLCLEVTKDCRLLDIRRLNEIVDALHAQGIKVIIDDFGSGFESIGFLKKLAADFIKFDRALVEEIEQNETDRQTMDYLARLADLRGAHVIVKGVETEAMRDILKEFTVSSMQGNFFDKPLPFDTLAARCGAQE